MIVRARTHRWGCERDGGVADFTFVPAGMEGEVVGLEITPEGVRLALVRWARTAASRDGHFEVLLEEDVLPEKVPPEDLAYSSEDNL